MAEVNNIALHQHRRRSVDKSAAWILSYADMTTLLLTFVLIILRVSDLNSTYKTELQNQGISQINYSQDAGPALQSLAQSIEIAIGESASIYTDLRNNYLTVTLGSVDNFELGKAELNENILSILEELYDEVSSDGGEFMRVVVEGHTDDLPIANEDFQSNWELSTARATNVIQFFREKGVPENHLEAIGFADTKPVAGTSDQAGEIIPELRELNRRIVIRLSNINNL